MAVLGYQLLHSDAFTAELEALGLDSSLFGAAGVPAPIFQALVPRRAGVFDSHAHTFGVDAEPASYVRASVGMRRNIAGVWENIAAGYPRPHYSRSGVFLGYLFEDASTNVFLNSDAPATQDIALTTGDWTLSVHGSGSVTSSDGTGSATGHGAATDGSDIVLDVTGAGTITFTVSGSPTLVQVENKDYSTSPIVTAGASATRALDQLSWLSKPAQYSESAGTLMIDVCFLYDGSATLGNQGLVNFSLSTSNILYLGQASLVKAFDGTNAWSLTLRTGGLVKEQLLRFAVCWSGSNYVLMRWNSDDGWTSATRPYDGAWNAGSGSTLALYRSGAGPICIKNLRIWNRDITSTEVARLFTPS